MPKSTPTATPKKCNKPYTALFLQMVIDCNNGGVDKEALANEALRLAVCIPEQEMLFSERLFNDVAIMGAKSHDRSLYYVDVKAAQLLGVNAPPTDDIQFLALKPDSTNKDSTLRPALFNASDDAWSKVRTKVANLYKDPCRRQHILDFIFLHYTNRTRARTSTPTPPTSPTHRAGKSSSSSSASRVTSPRLEQVLVEEIAVAVAGTEPVQLVGRTLLRTPDMIAGNYCYGVSDYLIDDTFYFVTPIIQLADLKTSSVSSVVRKAFLKHHPDKNGGVHTPTFYALKKATDFLLTVDPLCYEVYFELASRHTDVPDAQLDTILTQFTNK